MRDRPEVPVAVLSSRHSLDLVINTWIPGFLARSSPDLDVVLDLVHDDGIIVIDLTDQGGTERLEELRRRGVTAPIVAVIPAEQDGLLSDDEGVVIAHSSQVEDLTTAFALARRQRGSAGSAAVTAAAPVVADARAEGEPMVSVDARTGEEAGASEGGGASEDAAETDAAASVQGTSAPARIVQAASAPEDAPPAVASPESVARAEVEPTEVSDHGWPSDEDVVIDLTAEEPTVRPGWWARLRSRSAGSPATTGAEAVNGAAAPPERTGSAVAPPPAKSESEVIEPEVTEPDLTERDRTEPDRTEPDRTDAELSVAEATEPTVSEATEPVRIVDPSTSPERDRLIDLTTAEPTVTEGTVIDLTAKVPLGATLRAWALLDELDRVIGAGSAVVAVRTSAGEHAIVAGLELAAFEAVVPISATHPVMAELTDGPGWYLRTEDRPDLSVGLPLAECDELLVVGVPGAHRELDGVLIIGHFHPFTTAIAEQVAAAAHDVAALHRRLAVRWAPSAPVDLAALSPAPSASGSGTGAVLSADLVRGGWTLLDRLFPLLAGPCVVLTRASTGALVTTAAQHVDPDQACQVVAADHPLLARLAEEHGAVFMPSTGVPRELVRGLPVPRNPYLAAIAVGDAHAPDAVVLVSRQREVSPGEREAIVAAVAEHTARVRVTSGR